MNMTLENCVCFSINKKFILKSNHISCRTPKSPSHIAFVVISRVATSVDVHRECANASDIRFDSRLGRCWPPIEIRSMLFLCPICQPLSSDVRESTITIRHKHCNGSCAYSSIVLDLHFVGYCWHSPACRFEFSVWRESELVPGVIHHWMPGTGHLRR